MPRPLKKRYLATFHYHGGTTRQHMSHSLDKLMLKWERDLPSTSFTVHKLTNNENCEAKTLILRV